MLKKLVILLISVLFVFGCSESGSEEQNDIKVSFNIKTYSDITNIQICRNILVDDNVIFDIDEKISDKFTLELTEGVHKIYAKFQSKSTIVEEDNGWVTDKIIEENIILRYGDIVELSALGIKIVN